MTRTTVCGLVLCLVSPLMIGCASNTGLIRAQSPTAGPTVQARSETLGTLYGTNGLLTKQYDAKYEGKITTYTGPYGGQHIQRSGPDGYYDQHYGPGGQHGHGGQQCPECNERGDHKHGCRLSGRHGGNGRTSAMGPDGKMYEYPVHTHEFEYTPPQGLVYPQNNAPAPVVQYPYYTVKGPDDFFLQ